MPTRSSAALVPFLLSVCAVLSGCAAGGTSSSQALQGASAAVAWEITDLRHRTSPDGRSIRWYYTIVLKELAGRTVEFETVERSMHGELSVEAAETLPFKRRLAPNSQLRLYHWDGVVTHAFSSGSFGGVGQRPVTMIRRYRGRDDSGKPVVFEVRADLHAGTGPKAFEPAAIDLPQPATLDPADLRTLAGTWRGYYRDGSPFTLPLQLTIAEDGTFEGAADEPVTSRFRGNLAIRDGRVAYSRGPDSGTLVLHRQGDRRVLDGTITGTRAGLQAGTSDPVTFAFRLAASGTRSAAPPVSVPATTSAQPPPPPPSAPSVASAPVSQADRLTNDGVLAMVKAGIDESVILLKIKTALPAFDVGADALVQLKRAGVSDRILEAMIARASTKP